jgi:hypothetical protein
MVHRFLRYHSLKRSTRRGNVMRQIIMFAAIVLPTSAALADCPIGSFPWVDNWGNKICKRFDDGSTATTQGSLNNCPAGTHPWVDNWGNRICQAFQGGQQYYDTSAGCPIGTFKWVDTWGNPVCKSF